MLLRKSVKNYNNSINYSKKANRNHKILCNQQIILKNAKFQEMHYKHNLIHILKFGLAESKNNYLVIKL